MFKEFFFNLVFISNEISKLSKEYVLKYKTLRTSFHSDYLSFRHFLFLYFFSIFWEMEREEKGAMLKVKIERV